MKLIFGPNKKKNTSDVLYFDETDLNLPIGIEGYESTLSLFRDFANKTIDGYKIPEIFSYYETSLWWFIFPTIFPIVQKTMNFISKFTEFIENISPTTIQLTDDLTHFDLIKKICQEKKIKFSYSKLEYLKHIQSKKTIPILQKKRYHQIFKSKTNKRIQLYNSTNRSIPKIDGKIVFVIPNTYRRHRFDPDLGKSVKGEYIQGPIIQFLQELNKSIVGIDVDYTFKGDFEILNERLEEEIPWIPMELLLTNPSKENIVNFLAKFDDILKNEKFRSLFTHIGINFWYSIEDEFQKLKFSPYIPSYIELIESFKKFFKSNRPEAIFLPYETGPYALALIVACQENRIKTIGIQHGLLWKHNSDYSHTSFCSNENPFGMPLPDITLLFGKFAFEILLENGYPKDRFLIFGNPEFFNIDVIKNKLINSDIKLKYNLPQNKKIILFATGKSQRYYTTLGGTLDYDEQVLNTLLENFSNNENYFVIIKPHPGEYLSFYKQLIKNYNGKNFKIIDGDLFELLSVSDANISIFSTVLMDSVALEKMTIRIKFPGSTVPIPYDQYGVLVSCTLEELSDTIEDILNGKLSTDKLSENRQQFLKDLYNSPNPTPIRQLGLLLDKEID